MRGRPRVRGRPRPPGRPPRRRTAPTAPATGPGPFSGAGAGAGTATVLPMVARFSRWNCPPRSPRPSSAGAGGDAAVRRHRGRGRGRAGRRGRVAGRHRHRHPGRDRARVADQWHDDTGRLVRQADADEALARAEAFVARGDGPGGRARPLASTVETMACSDELLAGSRRWPRRTTCPATSTATSAPRTSTSTRRRSAAGPPSGWAGPACSPSAAR